MGNKMTNIALNEEFSFNGIVWAFKEENGSVGLKKIRTAKKGKQVSAPNEEEVVAFFVSKGFPEKLGREFYEYYAVNDWKDGKGNPVKNYKQKALAVWMKEDRKEKPKTQQVESKFKF
jgi:hypothetical protein